MPKEKVTSQIVEALSNARLNPTEFGVNTFTEEPIPFKNVGSHPNRNLELTAMKHWSITRKVMDKKKGDKGVVVFSVQAPTAPEAIRMVNEMVQNINEPFIKHIKRDA